MSSLKRKLALLLGASMALAAFAAPSASATEVLDPETGEPCPAVSPAVPQSENLSTVVNYDRQYESGGCTVHVTTGLSNSHMMGYPSYGTEPKNYCYSEYDAHVGPDGWGYATNVTYFLCSKQTSSCAGDRIITPVEWNSNGFFKYSNEETDLQIGLCGTVKWNYGTGTHWGLVSLDVTTSEEGVQTWTNQQTSSPGWIYQVVGGKWTAEGPGLTITH